MNRLLFSALLFCYWVAFGQAFSQNPNPKFSVYLTFLPDCPICKNYAVKLTEIYSKVSAQGGEMYLVYVKPRWRKKEAVRFQREFNLQQIPFLIDKKHTWVRRLNATIAPSCFLLDKAGNMVYAGAIDDRYVEIGKEKTKIEEDYLLKAISDFVAGRPIAVPQTKPHGCFIQ